MMDTRDRVEQETGDAGGDLCSRIGHDKMQVGEPKPVHGKPAAMFQCKRCGLKGFHWLDGIWETKHPPGQEAIL